MWSSTLIVVLMSQEEVEKFVRNHVRCMSWGVMTSVTKVNLFIPGTTVRVLINSTFTTSAFYTLVLGILTFCIMNVFTFMFVGAMCDIPLLKTVPLMLGSFGALPGSNVLKEPIVEG